MSTSGHTRPLGQLPVNQPPIDPIAPMTDLHALEIAMQALRDIAGLTDRAAEWAGIDDANVRYRRVEITAVITRLARIHQHLHNTGEHRIES